MIGLIDTTILTNIAEALRTQLGVDDRFSPNDMAEAILNINNTYDLPSYWQTYLDNRIPQIKTKINSASSDAAIFGFFTDAHVTYRDASGNQVEGNTGHTGEIMRYLTTKLGVKRWVFGGDALAYENTLALCQTDFDMVANWLKKIPQPIVVKGNHDLNPYGSPNLTDAQYHTMYFDALVENNPNTTYYYVDDTSKKTRYIIIDTRETSINDSYTNGDATEKAYINAEIAWIYNTLNNTPSGYQIIVLPHMLWWGAGRMSEGNLTLSEAGGDLVNLCGAYNKRESGTQWGQSYNFASGKGTVTLVLTGHTHIDYSKPYNGVVSASSTADSYQYANARPDSRPHTKGTINEQALDIWIVDKTKNKIDCLRIGCGQDRAFTIGSGQICNITNNLTNATTNNSATSVTGTYSATIIASKGTFTNGIYSVKCNNYDITSNYTSISSDGKTLTISINVPVPGDLVITATAAEVPTYSITNNLINCTSSSSLTSIAQNEAYNATLTPAEDYNITFVTITMGGTDITASAYNNGAISISAVTGNIVITAEAEEILPYTNIIRSSIDLTTDEVYNNIGYKNGYYISGGAERAGTGNFCTGLIPYSVISNGAMPTDILYIKGYTGSTSASYTRMAIFDENKTNKGEYNGFLSSNGLFNIETIGTGYYKLTPKTGINHTYNYNIGYVRFSFNQSDGKNVIMTRNEMPGEASTFSVTNNLSNVTTSNNSISVSNGASYTATLTPLENMTLATVTVMMGGTDVTSQVYSNGTISIPAVTGTLIITATAADESAAYTNLIRSAQERTSTAIYNNGLGYKNGYYISGENENANANDCMTGCIPYTIVSGTQPTDILYIKGYTGAANASHTRMHAWGPDKTTSKGEWNGFLSTGILFNVETLGTGYYKLTPKTSIQNSYNNIGYLQFSFNQPDGGTIIITRNEEIT